MKEYTKLDEKYIEDISSNVTIYSHNKTKARIACIKNNDENKTFAIAFRTPAINSTGLTHILEHSVLCGSKKYPVKDPFVELIKGSLNTFLNAFTFPDKTMYPCSSTNTKDFKNLMDVYLDCVFYPNIYKHKEIFMQEGWHYKLLNEDDDIDYVGVVYNEMKGAFSDPEQVLSREILHTIYPDNCYQYESGGDPKNIPDLSYEEFINFHKKYYSPSNSYIFIYGDIDMDERLEYLDKEYLSKFDYVDFDTNVLSQKPFNNPKEEVKEYPISKDDKLEDKTYLSANIALDSNIAYKDLSALTMMLQILFSEPGAIIKQAILDKNIGTDVDFSLQPDLKNPLISIIVRGSNKEKLEDLKNVLKEEFEKVVTNKINKEQLLAYIDFQEFKTREAKMSFPKGISYAMTMLTTWLYNENDYYSRLCDLDLFKEYRDLVNTSFFEDLITKYIINNNHKAYVTLVPSYTCMDLQNKALREKLDKYKKSLSKDEIKALIKLNEDLKNYQETPSTKEEIDTLPKLTLEDISIDPEKFNLDVIDNKYKVLYSNYETKSIGYVNLYFDISSLDYSLVPYAKLLTNVLALLSTKTQTYQEIGKKMNLYTGGLYTQLLIYETYYSKAKTFFNFNISYLKSKTNNAIELLSDVILNTKFDDKKRLYELLCQEKNNLESHMSYRGHGVALVRAGAKIDERPYLIDLTAGIAYLDFLNDLINNYDAKASDILEKLEYLYDNLLTKDRLIVGFTGAKEDLDAAINLFNPIYDKLNNKSKLAFNQKFTKNKYDEGIKTQYNVNYVAEYGTYSNLAKYNGTFTVLSNALNLDYLWMKVRVLGGAYGCSSVVSPLGYIAFTSYRDPNIVSTLDVYKDSVKFISELNPNEDELLKYKIGAVGSLIVVRHNSEKGVKAQTDYLLGLTYDYIKARFNELLNTKVEDFIKTKDLFVEALENSTVCVLGPEKDIIKNANIFDKVRSLN